MALPRIYQKLFQNDGASAMLRPDIVPACDNISITNFNSEESGEYTLTGDKKATDGYPYDTSDAVYFKVINTGDEIIQYWYHGNVMLVRYKKTDGEWSSWEQVGKDVSEELAALDTKIINGDNELAAQIQQLSVADSSLAGQISTVSDKANTSANTLATVQSQVNTNTADISAHSTAIAQHSTDIATNTSDISAHSTAIAQHSTDIATNTTGIAQNNASIDSFSTDVSVISTAFTEQQTYINTWLGVPRPWRSTTIPANHVVPDGSFVSFSEWPELQNAYANGWFDGLVLAYDATDEEKALYLGMWRPDAATPSGLYLPNLVNRYLRYVSNTDVSIGKMANDGLPNITAEGGYFEESTYYNVGDRLKGAFYHTDENTYYGSPKGNFDNAMLNFDASRSNAIYGASTEVMPKTVYVPVIMYLGEFTGGKINTSSLCYSAGVFSAGQCTKAIASTSTSIYWWQRIDHDSGTIGTYLCFKKGKTAADGAYTMPANGYTGYYTSSLADALYNLKTYGTNYSDTELAEFEAGWRSVTE